MRHTAILLAALAATATGCVESEKPPYAAGDVVFEPGLLGEWTVMPGCHTRGELPPQLDPNEPTHRIERTGGGTYRSTALAGEKETHEFTVFKLADRYFTSSKTEGGRYLVERLTVSGDRLNVRMLHLSDVLSEHTGAAKYKNEDFTTVLTGGTEEVRGFLSKHADDPGVWDRQVQVMRRAGGLKVTPAGLTGRKQRTLDYWAHLRLALQDPALPTPLPRSHLSALWSSASSEVHFLSTDGVDTDAVASGSLATELCKVMGDYAGSRAPKDPLGALIRESTGAVRDPATPQVGRETVLEQARDILAKLEAGRKKLSDRYGCEFPPIR